LARKFAVARPLPVRSLESEEMDGRRAQPGKGASSGRWPVQGNACLHHTHHKQLPFTLVIQRVLTSQRISGFPVPQHRTKVRCLPPGQCIVHSIETILVLEVPQARTTTRLGGMQLVMQYLTKKKELLLEQKYFWKGGTGGRPYNAMFVLLDPLRLFQRNCQSKTKIWKPTVRFRTCIHIILSSWKNFDRLVFLFQAPENEQKYMCLYGGNTKRKANFLKFKPLLH